MQWAAGRRHKRSSRRRSQRLLTTDTRCVKSVRIAVQVANVYGSLEWPAQALEADGSVF